MKFLIHTNGPNVSTGYGVQCRQLVDRLASAGHEVAVSCTYGHQGNITTWRSPGGHDIRLYPAGYETNSPDVIIGHAEHFFEYDPAAGWIIVLMDMWCFNRPVLLNSLKQFQVVAWTPVDHFPVPPDVLAVLNGAEAIPVGMSQFGTDLLNQAGLGATLIPLAVDTKAYKPTPMVDETTNARQIFGLPLDAFVVGMVAMNKGWSRDRKGFNEALRAFGEFYRRHPNAVLFMHTDKWGAAEGINLVDLARHAGVPEHAIVWTDPYAYRLGLSPEMMAAAYTAMDVLLSPSHGEGFCVPLIEAQACGTPVIASDFSAQPELVGAGWKVSGQPEWDPAQQASYVCPSIVDIIDKLEEAFRSDLAGMAHLAVDFAARYDADVVFADYWLPFIDTLLPPPAVAKPAMERVDVLVPCVREGNRERLIESLIATSPGNTTALEGRPDRTFSENVNDLLAQSSADWVLVVGDDCEFTEGWFDAAQALSTTADVIGTNDSEVGRTRNPEVAAGRHADHFFVRRSYIDDEGASLDGPGVLMPTAYQHWYTDREVVQLARARGVYAHAHDCRIVHHHPGYDGDEAAREDDELYMRAVAAADDDRRTFMERAPLIEGHRVTRVGV